MDYAYQVMSKNHRGIWILEKSYTEDQRYRAQEYAHHLYNDGASEVMVCRVDTHYGYFIDKTGEVHTLPKLEKE